MPGLLAAAPEPYRDRVPRSRDQVKSGRSAILTLTADGSLPAYFVGCPGHNGRAGLLAKSAGFVWRTTVALTYRPSALYPTETFSRALINRWKTTPRFVYSTKSPSFNVHPPGGNLGVDQRQGNRVGLEALLRWRDPLVVSENAAVSMNVKTSLSPSLVLVSMSARLITSWPLLNSVI